MKMTSKHLIQTVRGVEFTFNLDTGVVQARYKNPNFIFKRLRVEAQDFQTSFLEFINFIERTLTGLGKLA